VTYILYCREVVAAVGVNCTSPQFIGGLLESVRASVRKPLVVYPNSGEGWDAAAQQWTPADASGSLLFVVSLCFLVLLSTYRWRRHKRRTG
jgi:S-methylmethionine-dependent homocysteine/selenocysteine methylase